jgi:hypothetical protein
MPSEALGIKVWQSSELLPLCDRARHPYFLDYEGPTVVSLVAPVFLEDYHQINSSEKDRAHRSYLTVTRCPVSQVQAQHQQTTVQRDGVSGDRKL